ncbi:MAG TPA: DUF4190 domain-containing protein [Candidatus Saccharimonadales bacterium]|nr:DUF4190 domain-containing protein [Candidatus Saccharimonadales bacterium]
MYKIIGADQKEYGPISVDQLRQWISEGRVNGQTRVLVEGSGVWRTVSQLPEFAAMAPVPPPAPISMPVNAPKNSQMAVWALVTGLVSVLCCCNILGPVSLVLGIIALAQLKNNPQQTGSAFAIAGIVLGIVAIIMMIIGIIAFANSPDLMPNLQNLLPH